MGWHTTHAVPKGEQRRPGCHSASRAGLVLITISKRDGDELCVDAPPSVKFMPRDFTISAEDGGEMETQEGRKEGRKGVDELKDRGREIRDKRRN